MSMFTLSRRVKESIKIGLAFPAVFPWSWGLGIAVAGIPYVFIMQRPHRRVRTAP
jgi:hypothetical protein